MTTHIIGKKEYVLPETISVDHRSGRTQLVDESGNRARVVRKQGHVMLRTALCEYDLYSVEELEHEFAVA